MPPNRRYREAFSLIEVVIVMAIIAVVAALAVPRFSSASDRFALSAAARRVAADLELARAQAVNASAAQQVILDVAGDSYKLPGVAALDDPADTYEVRLAGGPYRSRLVSAFSQTGSNVTVTFNGFGVPDVSGQVVVECKGEQRVIVLDADTGQASVQ